MRLLKEICVTQAGRLFGLCEDGTLWTADPVTEGQPQWRQLETPPEGDHLKREPTLEEIGEHLEKTGKKMVVGRGLKKSDSE